MVQKDRAYWAALNEERQAIQRRIAARARIDHLLDGNYKVLDLEKAQLYATIKGYSIAADAARYVEIQDEQWEHFTGRKDTGRNKAPPTSGTRYME